MKKDPLRYCCLCNKEFKNVPNHLGAIHKDCSKEEYFLKFIGEKTFCAICGKDTRFISLVSGYQKHCSRRCAKKNPEERERYEKTCLMKYGVKNPSLLDKITEKRKETMILKYGGWPAQNKGIKEKQIDTLIKNYGVDNPRKSQQIKEKMKINSIKKYSTEYPCQNQKVKDKQKETMKYNFFNLLISTNRLKDFVIPNFEKKDYVDVKTKYSWKCSKCQTIFDSHINNGLIPRCPICYPPWNGKHFTSKIEEDIINFCKFYFPNLIERDRYILNGKELDIFIPEINLAIEVDGVFWHSELNGKDKYYHLNKTLECEKKSIQLIHIFEDEWYNKRDIVESILLAKMGKIENKIYARKCEIKKIKSSDAYNFLLENHLQGPINGKSLGLFFLGELVSIITIGKSRFNKNYDIELLRFCNKKNTIVIGGLGKLIKRVNGQIITYNDLRFSNGQSYETAGFKLISQSKPGFFYLKNNVRLSRLKFQKHKLPQILEIFDPTLSAWNNMQLNGYDRIWDCGNLVFKKENKK